MYGRNYGEQTYRSSDDYKDLLKTKQELTFAKNELENVKTKFQNILNGSDNKKQAEILLQIRQVFLADLGLHASETAVNEKESFDKSTAVVAKALAKAQDEATAVGQKTEKPFDLKKLKSYEWILDNSVERKEILENLKNVELRNLNDFLAAAKPASVDDFKAIYGKYRGHINSVDQVEYGSLVIEISAIERNGSAVAKGLIQIFKENRETMSSPFLTDKLGYRLEGSAAFVIDPGNDGKFYQLYKTKETQQLAGFFYQRLPHGSTKTIGSFLLNRVDLDFK